MEEESVPTKKPASLKKKITVRKPKKTRAPGKPDPKFLSRLSRAMAESRQLPEEEEVAPKRAPLTGTAEPPPRPAAGKVSPAESRAKPAGGPAKVRTPRPGGKAPASGKDRRAGLLKELKSLLAELDEEGLDFLLEQAHVHRYNMEVERLNDAEERRENGRSAPRAASRKTGSGKASAPVPKSPSLRIERSQDGNTYHVVSGGRYKMFASDEMLALVRIAHANPDSAEAGRGLHRWMTRERTDALADLEISGPSDPGLAALAALLRRSFAAPPKKR